MHARRETLKVECEHYTLSVTLCKFRYIHFKNCFFLTRFSIFRIKVSDRVVVSGDCGLVPSRLLSALL